jgi:hypothetical protein
MDDGVPVVAADEVRPGTRRLHGAARRTGHFEGTATGLLDSADRDLRELLFMTLLPW